jgi:hypothetical protein
MFEKKTGENMMLPMSEKINRSKFNYRRIMKNEDFYDYEKYKAFRNYYRTKDGKYYIYQIRC